MYPNERFLKILKGHVKNRYLPEGYIAERYMVEEASDLCVDFLSNVDPIGILKSRRNGQRLRKGTSESNVISISVTECKLTCMYYITLMRDLGEGIKGYAEKGALLLFTFDYTTGSLLYCNKTVNSTH